MDTDDLRRIMEQQLAQSQRLKARIRALEDAATAPLAVVGLGLRLPGGQTTPEEYWDFLLGDTDPVGPIPEDRPGLRSVFTAGAERPGRSYVDRAGFLRDVAHFDPAFFGISQREAETLDPQQRLLLETSWEAMERAGIAVRRQERLEAGVFVGLMTADYTERLGHRADRTALDPYYGTGGGHAMAAGRISYALGFSGPALTVDTACSSSLVALHLAAQSLRRAECRYALVGGANVFFSPDLMVSLCQSKALAPDGRSKAFLDSADGYGRGEGVGTLVLMRLADAEREQRPVLAVLRGTAVNHDGASSGLTVPNGPAQQQVVRAALADGGIAPAEVGYVEAHGTGTSLGDPIEAGALDAVLGSGAPGRTEPLLVGTVKSRIGHLESAAGIAGLIKLVLMLRHGTVPVGQPESAGPLNRLIPWQRLRVEVPRRTRPWPAGQQRRIAGISAFGMSGTNAHAVLEAYTPAPAEPAAAGPELLTLSAKDPDSLAALAEDTVARLARTGPAELAAVCATLRDGRTAFPYRLAVTGADAERLAVRLAAAADALDRSPAGAASPQPPVRLRLAEDTAAVGRGLDALLAAHPALDGPDDSADAPGVRLARRLARLGLRVDHTVERPAVPGAVAELVREGRSLLLLDGDPAAAPGLLLDALAELFRAGADLRFESLRRPGTPRTGDLPTYAFRRVRCWIDEPDPATADAAPGRAPARADGLPDVGAFLRRELARVLHADQELLDLSQSLLDVGGDSFTAMQLTIAIEEAYGVEVPVDELSADLPLVELFELLGGFVTGSVRELEPLS
ncbi:beta-ketoacyl synthase N-terminal-like domain-containing protein [Kitasatospora sp. NPDC054939]